MDISFDASNIVGPTADDFDSRRRADARIDPFKWTPERIVLSMRTSDAMGGRDMPCQSPSSPPPGDARQVRKKRVGCTATRLSPTGSYRTYKLRGPRELKSDEGRIYFFA